MDKKEIFLNRLGWSTTYKDNLPIGGKEALWLLSESLKEAKYIRVTDILNEYLMNMEASLEYTHAPFENTFLDTNLFIPEIDVRIKSILVTDCLLHDFNEPEICKDPDCENWGRAETELEKKESRTIENNFNQSKLIYFTAHILENGEEYLMQGKAYDRLSPILFKVERDKILHESLASFILSLFNFILHPEVAVINKANPQETIASGSSGSSKYYIAISGKTRKYVYDFDQEMKEVKSQGKFPQIVRGYYRHYLSSRYVNKRNTVDFIHPFIKRVVGDPSKSYLVKSPYETVFVNEQMLRSYVLNLFNQYEIKKDRTVLKPFEIDIYIPDLKLGFEYDGEQHYIYPNAFHNSREEFEKQQLRDSEKRKKADNLGIKLVTIRYDEKITVELVKDKLKSLGVEIPKLPDVNTPIEP